MNENDLPLLSNINCWRARHYMIQLEPNFCTKHFSGELIIFFDKPSKCELMEKCCTKYCQCFKQNLQDRDDILADIILECCDLEINCVKEIQTQISELPLSTAEFFDIPFWTSKPMVNVEFMQDKWSLTISVDKNDTHYSKVIYIHYKTKECGKSIYWRKDCDSNLCFFTPGSFINNRSLLPCQDRPLAMSTWQAWIIAPFQYYVAMTGDELPVITNVNHVPTLSEVLRDNSDILLMRSFYYFTSMVLPISTIAIAAGKWKLEVIVPQEKMPFSPSSSQNYSVSSEKTDCCHSIYPCYLERGDPGDLLPLTFLLPESQQCNASHLFKFAKYCLKASYKLLGRHPFKRLEIVLLPRCFANLGLASPNLIFISKTLLTNDSFSHIRLAHEISHTWFGITIGAQDWQEEWLSEGFATFLENPIYTLALEEEKMEESSKEEDIPILYLNEYSNFFSLRSSLYYKVLISEFENTDMSLQTLSKPTDPIVECDSECSSSSIKNKIIAGSIANALNSEKSFLQVHYLKGYFMLLYLSEFVSLELFLIFLKKFCTKFHGQLITSNDFFDFYFIEFPEIKKFITKEDLFNKWLCNSTMNSHIKDKFEEIVDDNELIKNIREHFSCWNQMMSNKGRSILSLEVKTKLLTTYKLQYSDQLVLLLEWLLEKSHISVCVLKQIFNFYKLSYRNADVRHRWCELVIKHDYPDIESIKRFLMNEQSMGVYLYGELMISNKKKFKNLVHNIYEELSNELDHNSKEVIKSMIFS